jgi:glycosyltransferase involved in cell wall biosynthesis
MMGTGTPKRVGAPAFPQRSALCSVIITNYNYAQYVAAAIDSALDQTYANVETIVVDDGSTDNSVDVIERYGERARLVRKENGGQASAMNRGFAASSGDIVFFLDADDMLLPDTVERVVAAWRSGVAKVHFRLQKVLSDGQPVDGAFLPPYGALPSGDLRAMVHEFGFYPSPPASGNAFARWYLDRILPMPEEVYRVAADTLLIGPAPLLGEIGVVDGIGGFWRLHGSNVSSVGLGALEKRLTSDLEMVRCVRTLPGLAGRSICINARWPQHLKERLLVSKLCSASKDPESRTSFSLALAYVTSVATWPEYALRRRVMLVAWALAVLLLPKSVLGSIPRIAGSAIRLS